MATFDLAEVKASIRQKSQDDVPRLTDPEIQVAVDDAVHALNMDRPLSIVHDINGDGSQNYALPSTFEKGFSDAERVEAPAGQNPPLYRDRDDDWFLYEDPSQAAGSQLRLRFLETTPKVGDIIRVTFSGRHTLNQTTSTLNARTFLAVVAKGLVFIMRARAAKFTSSSAPTIDADTVDHAARGQNFLFLSERWESEYKRLIGAEGDVKAAQALGEVDVVFTHGEDMLFHPARRH